MEEAHIKIFLADVYHDFWVKLLDHYGSFHVRMLNQQEMHPTSHEWVGLHKHQEDKLPELVVIACNFKECRLGLVHFSIELMGISPKSIFGSQYFTLSEVKAYARDAKTLITFTGWMTHVRVDTLSHGSGQTQIDLFFGILDQLFFDLARWWWLEITPFVAYVAKFERK